MGFSRPGRWARAGVGAAALAVGLVASVSLAGCGQAPTGTITLRFSLAPDDGAGLTDLRVEPAWGGLNRGPERDVNWLRVPVVAPAVALVPGAAPVAVARGPVPAGDYQRVFVATPRVRARTPDGRVVELTSHIEPTVWPVVVPAKGAAEAVIDLVIRPQPAWREPGWAVFVKGARSP